VEWHDNGQGWSVLAARTGLSQSEVRDIYEEAGGENPGRVGGQRYGGGRSKAAGEEEEAEGGDDATEEKPASRRRGRRGAEAAEEAKPAATRSRSAPARLQVERARKNLFATGWHPRMAMLPVTDKRMNDALLKLAAAN